MGRCGVSLTTKTEEFLGGHCVITSTKVTVSSYPTTPHPLRVYILVLTLPEHAPHIYFSGPLTRQLSDPSGTPPAVSLQEAQSRKDAHPLNQISRRGFQ